MKTIELIVDERPCKPTLRYRDQEFVAVVVAFTRKDLRERLKAAGGRWDPEEKLWRVRYGAIRGDEELEEKILRD